MIRQRSFVTNNNKENNAVISNIESEGGDDQEYDQYSYGKMAIQPTNISTNVPSKNAKKPFISQNSIPLEENNYRYESTSSQPNQDAHIMSTNQSNGSNHSSNNSNSSSNGQTATSSLTAQMLLNDVRALAAQNQKTEQNLRELQRKINQQKGKRFTQIHHQDDKENAQLGDRKLSRNHSSSNQSYQSYNENYSSNNQVNSINNNANNYNNNNNGGYTYKTQQTSVLNPVNTNYQNIPSKLITTNNNPLQSNNDVSMNGYLNQKSKIPVSKQYEVKEPLKTQQNVQSLNAQAQQQQQLANQKKALKPKLGEKNLSDQQTNKRFQQQNQGQQNQVEYQENSSVVDDSKILREETISSRLARVIINKHYSHDILNYIKQTEPKFVPKNCLQNHNISFQLRAKMVDWMIEVMKSYKCSEETYFMSVRIMDHFLEKSKKRKEPSDLHLIGVTCMFIACKYEEIYPLRLKIVEDRIAHKKLSEEQIKATEAEILNTLGFNLIGTSPYEITMQTLTLIGLQESLTHQEFIYCHRICLYLSKMVLYDYEYFKSSSYSLLSASIIYIVFKIISQMINNFTAEQNIKPVIQILKIDSKQLIDTSTRILNLAKNFDLLFPDLKNLKKFNGFELKSDSEDYSQKTMGIKQQENLGQQ